MYTVLNTRFMIAIFILTSLCNAYYSNCFSQAVVQLYGDPSSSDVTAAEKWLIGVQELKEVWSVAWQLLERDVSVIVQSCALVVT